VLLFLVGCPKPQELRGYNEDANACVVEFDTTTERGFAVWMEGEVTLFPDFFQPRRMWGQVHLYPSRSGQFAAECWDPDAGPYYTPRVADYGWIPKE